MHFSSTFLPNSQIEVIRPLAHAGRVRHALFDFDGTLSLIREGWQAIMVPMMVEILMATPAHESRAEVEQVVEAFVARLTGKQTIYQMIQLGVEVEARGGSPLEPLEYKRLYNERLNRHIQNRLEALRAGRVKAEALTVPGTYQWLEVLKQRGVTCYLASGTDERYVLEEAELLGLTPYFAEIYGAQDNYQNFSKKIVIERIIETHQLNGDEFAAFGDGYVEIEDSKAVNGIAVGLATDEKARCGVDAWKRSRLISAGADLIIPDFREYPALEAYLFNSH